MDHSLSTINLEQFLVLDSNYVYDNFAKVLFNTRLYKGLKFNSGINQNLDFAQQGQQPIITSNAFTSFIYQNKNFQISNRFDLAGNVTGSLQTQLESLDNLTLYLKGDSANLQQGNFTVSLGAFQSKENYAYKVKFNQLKKAIEAQGKMRFDLEDGASMGVASGLSFNFIKKQFSLYKAALWYQNKDLKMSAIHTIPSREKFFEFHKIQYSVFRKIDEVTNLGIEMNYLNGQQRSYSMNVGVDKKFAPNLLCGAKVDDKLKLATFFKFDISPAAYVVMSNRLDLNLRSKQETQLPNQFPFGIKVVINDS